MNKPLRQMTDAELDDHYSQCSGRVQNSLDDCNREMDRRVQDKITREMLRNSRVSTIMAIVATLAAGVSALAAILGSMK